MWGIIVLICRRIPKYMKICLLPNNPRLTAKLIPDNHLNDCLLFIVALLQKSFIFRYQGFNLFPIPESNLDVPLICCLHNSRVNFAQFVKLGQEIIYQIRSRKLKMKYPRFEESLIIFEVAIEAIPCNEQEMNKGIMLYYNKQPILITYGDSIKS